MAPPRFTLMRAMPKPSGEGEFRTNPQMGPPPDWNYQTATRDWEGNPLPAGAQGFTPYGEPYYDKGHNPVTGNFLEWARGTWGRITEPLAGTGGAQLWTQGKEGEEGQKANVGQTAARVAGESIRGIGEALSIPAYAAESALGAGELARAATTESPLPDITAMARDIVNQYGGEYQGDDKWSRIGRFIRSMILESPPPVALYNVARLMLSPGTIAEKVDRVKVAAQSSRITYSAWIDPAIRQEFIRRYNAGADPFLLQEELKNPIAELAGQLIFDPLNFLTGPIGFGKGKTATAVADDVAQGTADLIRVTNVAEPVEDVVRLAAQQSADAAVATRVVSREAVRTGLEARGAIAARAARPIEGFWALTATGKRLAVEQTASRAIRFLFNVHGNPDDAADMLKAVVEMTSHNADEMSRGINALAHSPMGQAAFSDDMIDLGITLRKMLTNEDGVVDAEKFLDGIGNIENYDDAVKFAENAVSKGTAGQFPTVAEMIAKGQADNVKPIWRTLSSIDAKLSAPKNKINQLFADIYMGLNPGYAVRNLVQNYVHAFVDAGPGVFAHRPGGWLAEATDWLGGYVTKRAQAGIGAVGSLEGTGRKLFGQRWAQDFERWTSEAVYGITVKRTMEKTLTFGRALPDIRPLTEAGLDPKLASTILNRIITSRGDVSGALKLLRQEMATGSVDAYRALEWASPALVKRLKQYQLGTDNLFDAIVKAIGTNDKDAALKSIDEIVAGVRKEGEKIATEGLPVSANQVDRLKTALVRALSDSKNVEPQEAAKLLNAIEVTTHNSVIGYMQALSQYSPVDPRIPELISGMGGRWNEANTRAADMLESAWKEWDLMKKASGGQTLSGTPEAIKFWELVRTNVMDMFKGARDEVYEAGERAALELSAIAPPENVERSLAYARLEYQKALQWDAAKYTDELGWFVGEGEEVTKLTPPYVPGTPPSRARYASETTPAVEAMVDAVKAGLEKHWGETSDVLLDEGLEAALKNFETQAVPRVNEARQLAAQVAERARDFCLLNYEQKKGIDLLLGYVFPYQFWYNRTYQNWMLRFARNPVIVADYAKYRGALEEIHAGSPDWWKYNVNTNELLGLDSENPMFFNLEALLNPLNGITGIDFNDADKRVDWWTTAVDNIGKFGPSVWTPISLATAVSLYMRGEKDAAARWAGRLIPQTATIKSALGLLRGRVSDLPLQGEFDPMVHFFSGGLDPYERKRVGRALGFLVQEEVISEAEALDAAYTQKGDVWDLALDRAVTERAPGQLMSFIGGSGTKARSVSDMQIDQFWGDYSRMWNMWDGISSDEWRNAWNTLRRSYPFMDAVLLSRKTGIERDVAYSFNVLSRIAPGDSYDFAQWANIPDGLMEKFWDGKGDMAEWSESDRMRFMAGIIDLAAVLDVPDFTTKAEWTQASNAYKSIQKIMEGMFGEDIFDRIAAYNDAKGETQVERDRAEAMLRADPQIEEANNYKSYAVMSNPLTAKYYSSIYQIQAYWESQMYEDIEKRLGADIWDKWDEYWYLKDSGGNANAYKRSHPELAEYGKIKDAWEPIIAENILKFGDRLRTIPYDLRTEEGPIAESLAQREPGLPQLSWGEWQSVLGPGLSRLVEDYAYGEDLPDSAMSSLETAGGQLGIYNAGVVLQLAVDSLR